jgi:hypothetical protein
MARCFGVENDGRIACADFFDQKLRGRQREFAILLERQFPDPGVKQLHGCRAGSNLRLQVLRCGVRDAFKERAKKVRVGIEQRFRRGNRAL